MAYRRNADDWGYIHPECAPEPGRYSHVPIPAFFNEQVQLAFPIPNSSHKERMWVYVTGPAETEGQELQGFVNQDPKEALDWLDETIVEFLREEVIKVYGIDLPPTPRSNPIYRRNADDVYRQAERRAAETGSDEDQAKFLREKIRVGETPSEILPLLAYLTYRSAQILLENYDQIPEIITSGRHPSVTGSDIPSPEDLRLAASRLEREIRQIYESSGPENPPTSLEALGGGGVDNAVDMSVQQFYQSQYNSIRKTIKKVFTQLIKLCPETSLRVRVLDLRYRITTAAVNLHKNYLRDNTDEAGEYARFVGIADMALLESSAEGQGLTTEYPLYQDTFTDLVETTPLEANFGWDDYNLQQALYQQMLGLYAYLGPRPHAFAPQTSPHAFFLNSLAYSILELGWPPVRAAIIEELIPWLLNEDDPLARVYY